MKNLWPDLFEENTKPSAKTLIEEQAKLLPKLTGGMVFAEVSELSPLDSISHSMNDDFAYRFDIKGKFLENYRFNVLCFSHDITLFPVKFKLDEKIGKELGIKRSAYGYIQSIETVENLEGFLGAVLTSERLKDVVGSIIRLSK